MWKEIEGRLYKRYQFKDFSEAFAFMTRVAMLAEGENHHPRWMNEWNVVEIWLVTHDAHNTVTEKDRKMASKIDSIWDKGN